MVLISKNKKPLKKSKLGFEIELHLLDEKENIANKAPELINAVKKEYPDLPIFQECGKNFVELISFPGVKTYRPALDLIDSVQKTITVAEKLNISLYPFSYYPHKWDVEFSDSESYNLKFKILRDRFSQAPLSSSFHCHYTLPKSVFDYKAKNIRLMMDSKLARSFVNSYNFCIAADPAFLLFAQSSPFLEGENIAKDVRALSYRGGRRLKYEKGLYTKYPIFGALSIYKQTMTDIINIINKRWKKWKKLSSEHKIDAKKIYQSILDTSWNPVKINKVGTLEYRGMDTNFMSISYAIAIMFKYCLLHIHREFIEVIPSDLAIKEPFKYEKGIIYIPPFTYLRNKLQLWSVYKGYQKKEMYEYAKRLFNLAKSFTPKKYHIALEPIADMINHKKSMSDKILDHAKRKGYLKDNKISRTNTRKLALHYSKQFVKDVEKTKQTMLRLSTL